MGELRNSRTFLLSEMKGASRALYHIFFISKKNSPVEKKMKMFSFNCLFLT